MATELQHETCLQRMRLCCRFHLRCDSTYNSHKYIFLFQEARLSSEMTLEEKDSEMDLLLERERHSAAKAEDLQNALKVLQSDLQVLDGKYREQSKESYVLNTLCEHYHAIIQE